MGTYYLGDNSPEIRLAVNITTIGLAASRAMVFVENSGNTPVPVAHSKDVTGDIALTGIGAAAALNGKTLLVLTKVDLGVINNEDDRKREFERITSATQLEGGAEREKPFSTDSKEPSDDYRNVFLSTRINLI